MVEKIKLPSKNVLIIKHYLYKGYQGIIMERADARGNILKVFLLTTGTTAIIPIQNIVFVVDEKTLLTYTKELARYVLTQYKPNKQTLDEQNISNIIENFKNLKLSDKFSSSITEEINEIERFEPMDIDKRTNSSGKSSTNSTSSKNSSNSLDLVKSYDESVNSPEDILVAGYKDKLNVRMGLKHDKNPMTLFLLEVDELLQLNYDVASIEIHSKKLQEFDRNFNIRHLFPSIELYYKIVILAYVFVHYNNMGINIPKTVVSCKKTPNDDPGFIQCLALKSRFIEDFDDFKELFHNTVLDLINFLKTTIIPSSCNNVGIKERSRVIKKILSYQPISKSRRTFRGKINKTNNKKKDITEIFSLTPAQLYTKEQIISKILIKIPSTKGVVKKSLEYLIDNFDKLVQEKYFSRIEEESPKLAKLIKPFIKEFHRQSNITKTFNPTDIVKSNPKTEEEQLKKNIVEDFRMKLKTNKQTGDYTQDKIIDYLYKNTYNIVNMSGEEVSNMVEKNDKSIFTTEYDKKLADNIVNVRISILKAIRNETGKQKISRTFKTEDNVNKITKVIKDFTLS